MSWYPKAVPWPIKRATKYGKRKKTDGIILHVDAGNAYNLGGYWNNPDSGDKGSVFHIAKDGTVFQYCDADYIQWTSVAGSTRTIGIETQGYANEPWTDEQVASLIDVTAWAAEEYNFPVQALTSSNGQRGVGFHRLGAPVSKGASISRTGGELWAKDYSKVCPGPFREKQIPTIIEGALDMSFTDGDRAALAYLYHAFTGETGDLRIAQMVKSAQIVEQRTNGYMGVDGKTPSKYACQGDIDIVLRAVAGIPNTSVDVELDEAAVSILVERLTGALPPAFVLALKNAL